MDDVRVRLTAAVLLHSVLLALLGGCSSDETPAATRTVAPSASATPTSDLAAKSELALKMIATDSPGCSAAVGRDGTVVWANARGVADMEPDAPLTTASLLDIGSVSKQFTATAVLILVADGKVSMDDPIADYVDDLPAWGTQITLADLMHHTTGLPDFLSLVLDAGYTLDDTVTQEQAINEVRKAADLHFPAGSKWEYSNTNYLLLAEVVSRVSGESLPVFLHDSVFAPLDLDMTLAPLGGLPGEAISYEGGGGQFEPQHSGWLTVGPGFVHTTPSELVRWADVYRTGQIGSYNLLDAQFDGAATMGAGAVFGDGKYGAGMIRRTDGSLDHSGLWLAYISDFQVSVDRHLAVAVSCNGRLYQPDTIARNLLDVWQEH